MPAQIDIIAGQPDKRRAIQGVTQLPAVPAPLDIDGGLAVQRDQTRDAPTLGVGVNLGRLDIGRRSKRRRGRHDITGPFRPAGLGGGRTHNRRGLDGRGLGLLFGMGARRKKPDDRPAKQKDRDKAQGNAIPNGEMAKHRGPLVGPNLQARLPVAQGVGLVELENVRLNLVIWFPSSDTMPPDLKVPAFWYSRKVKPRILNKSLRIQGIIVEPEIPALDWVIF